MKGSPAVYLGRIVDKKHFRAFIHGTNGEKRLIESWDAFEAAMQSGVWFPTVEDAQASKSLVEDIHQGEVLAVEEKPKAKAKPKGKAKPKTVKVEELDEAQGEIAPDELDDMVYEVKDGE